MGGNENEVLLITENGVESWPHMRKEAVAGQLMQRAADWLRDKGPRGSASAGAA